MIGLNADEVFHRNKRWDATKRYSLILSWINLYTAWRNHTVMQESATFSLYLCGLVTHKTVSDEHAAGTSSGSKEDVDHTSTGLYIAEFISIVLV